MCREYFYSGLAPTTDMVNHKSRAPKIGRSNRVNQTRSCGHKLRSTRLRASRTASVRETGSSLHLTRYRYGGEGGIRTRGTVAGTHAFQACRLSHSRTSPQKYRTPFITVHAETLPDAKTGTSGGEGGIRTRGTLPYTAFRERRLKPLSHLSNRRV